MRTFRSFALITVLLVLSAFVLRPFSAVAQTQLNLTQQALGAYLNFEEIFGGGSSWMVDISTKKYDYNGYFQNKLKALVPPEQGGDIAYIPVSKSGEAVSIANELIVAHKKAIDISNKLQQVVVQIEGFVTASKDTPEAAAVDAVYQKALSQRQAFTKLVDALGNEVDFVKKAVLSLGQKGANPTVMQATEAKLTAQLQANPVTGCGYLDLFCYIQKGVIWALQGLLSGLFALVGSVIALAIGIIETFMKLNMKVLDSPLISQGFSVTLSLANLGFVLAIIAIAFVTMLKLHNYDTKKMLWRLVAAAVLVNFSFLIAGSIIDFTNVLSQYFLNGTTPNGTWDTNFGSQLAQSMSIQVSGMEKTAIGGLLGFVLSFGLAIILSIIVLIVLFGIGIMLVIRYLYIVVLLILMPLAWLFWIVPNLERYWTDWWSKFLEQVFFLPAVTFFLYLAVQTSTSMGALASQAVAGSAIDSSFSGMFAISISQILDKFVRVGLFAAALIVGKSLGAHGSKGTLAFAKKLGGNTVTGFVGKREPFQKKLEKLGTTAGEGTAKGLSRVPLLGGALARRIPLVGGRLSDTAAKARAQRIIDSASAADIAFAGTSESASSLAAKVNESRDPNAEIQKLRNIAFEEPRGLKRFITTGADKKKRAEALVALSQLRNEGRTGALINRGERDKVAEVLKGMRAAKPTQKNVQAANATIEEIKKKEKKSEKEEAIEHLAHVFAPEGAHGGEEHGGGGGGGHGGGGAHGGGAHGGAAHS